MTLLTVKEYLYMNLLRAIISSLVNKNYYFFVVILFLCYVFPFASMDFLRLFLSTNVLLFDVLAILMHHLCYSSVSSVKKRNFMSKGKTILSQAA